MKEPPWWRDAVVYQVYPRSFQDSDGDGVGDLRGIAPRLDHLARLGVDALWLSPIYPSPLADFGYDVSDSRGVDPAFGTLADFDAPASPPRTSAGLQLLMDLVPCHTSIEHPWFREHPDWYVWADGDGAAEQLAAPPSAGRRGRATRDSGRWYLHSFYPEQPDLDWRNPEVVAAMQDVIALLARPRGVDGFRLDAIDRLLKDPELRDDPPAAQPFALPLPEEYARARAPALDATRPDIGARAGARCARRRATRSSSARSTCPPRGLGALPRAPRRGLLLRALHAPLEAGGAARGDRGRRSAVPGHRLGAVQPRLRRAWPPASGRGASAWPRCCC